MTFPKVLRKHGFKRLKQHHEGIIPWGKGDDPSTSLYCEVYKESWGHSAWVVGCGIPDGRYPGGKFLSEPDKLDEILNTI